MKPAHPRAKFPKSRAISGGLAWSLKEYYHIAFHSCWNLFDNKSVCRDLSLKVMSL